MYTEPGKFELEEDVRDDALLTTFRRLETAITGAQERNDDEADYDDWMKGRQMEGMPKPWPNACTLVSTLIPENVSTLLSQLAVFVRQPTLAYATAKRAADKEAANKKEKWLMDTWQEEGLPTVLYHYTQNLLKSKASVIYSGYCEKKRQVQSMRYAEMDERTGGFRHWNTEAGSPDDILEPEDRAEGVPYIAFPVTLDEVEKRGDYRVVELRDFYFFPPNARDIQSATVVFERLMLTEDDLLTGIQEYGYDKDTVMEMIRRGPTHDSDGSDYAADSGEGVHQSERDRDKGIRADIMTHGDGFYECFLGFGKLPKLWEDGEARLPQKYWQQEAQMLLCYQHKLAPLLVPCQYPRKPYVMRSLEPDTNSPYGTGMVQRLEGLAMEATHRIRLINNSADIQTVPEKVATDEVSRRNPQKTSFPGKWWRADSVNDIVDLKKDLSFLTNFQPLQYIDTKAQALAAAKGFGQVNEKQPLVAEMESATSNAIIKFDYYSWNAYGTLIPELASMREEWELLFNPDAQYTLYTADGEMEITANDLRVPVRWSAAQMDSENTPRAKVARNSAVLNIQLGYFNALKQFPQYGEQLWNAARQALMDLTEREPEKVIGEKPEPPPMLPMGGMGLPGMPPGMGAGMPPNGATLPSAGANLPFPPGLPPMPPMGVGNGMG